MREPSPGQGEGAERQRGGRGAEAAPRTPAPLPAAFGSHPLPERERVDERGGLILLGEFGRAHGLRGEVRLKSFTGEPEAIAAYGPLAAPDGRRFTLTSVRPVPGGQPDLLIARVTGVGSREAAEALNRVRLFVERDKLPAPEEDEFLHADLVGLRVETADGTLLGTVLAVVDYGGGDLLEVTPTTHGPSALLPFTKAFVPTVDIPGRRLVADPPADLFEVDRPPAGAARPPANAAKPHDPDASP